MRNPLNLAFRKRDTGPTLRDRLTVTKGKLADVRDRAALAMKVGRIALKTPEPTPEPPNRVALINYATWLWHERRRVCGELYPHLGPQAHAFVLGLNAAEDWHFNGHNRSGGWAEKPPATPRAIQILDAVGVDWRADIERGGLSHVDLPDYQDNGRRPKLPHGWPAPDAALLEALDDLTRLDAAQMAMSNGTDREADEVPGYDALEAARDGALTRLAKVRAESLTGLQTKAKALLAPSVSGVSCDFEAIAQSLARDVTGASQRMIEPRPDPILVAIDECRRLMVADEDAQGAPDIRETATALIEHIDGVLLQTVPTTARGCGALAKFAAEFQAARGVALEQTEGLILSLIARSPLL